MNPVRSTGNDKGMEPEKNLSSLKKHEKPVWGYPVMSIPGICCKLEIAKYSSYMPDIYGPGSEQAEVKIMVWRNDNISFRNLECHVYKRSPFNLW